MLPLPCAVLQRSVLLIAQDIARGLLHIHTKNIVHGDLSCSNVLLQACAARAGEPLLSMTAKLADFGLSVRMEDGQSHHSRLFQGTPHYMAPEVLARGSLSKASGERSARRAWHGHLSRRPMRHMLAACGGGHSPLKREKRVVIALAHNCCNATSALWSCREHNASACAEGVTVPSHETYP